MNHNGSARSANLFGYQAATAAAAAAATGYLLLLGGA
jgi:hypothetical protein